ncbi:hypothetical protein K450DRAFT_272512 [Umbelopsis ramanniana AG]|uniref:Restriction of telomere capping protein 4 n=1 Tax=Umbelopsis ramanniana AG TaxID=1314678 RepID=A0AAD5E9I0_UMBRA|nr:uncharacterized protein K450DRAFT_272512 [Umbelopsis ramanniana AG]KAI8578861.1 hypothetical protein K450DRAFT_272512 [Umbelopsis ramanniana AG]
MSNLTNRHHIRQGDPRRMQSGSLKNSSSKETSFRSFDDDFDDFQASSKVPPSVMSSKRKRPSENAESQRHGSRLQLSESHTETKKNTKLESDYKPSTPKTKSLKLSTSSSHMSELPTTKVPSSSGNVRALSYLKKKSMGSLASASQEQTKDLFAASLPRKVKPLNPFGVSTTIRTDVLSLPKPRKSRRRKENESLKSIDEIKARLTSVSALDHTSDNANTLKCPYCHQVLEKPLSKSLEDALAKVLATDDDAEQQAVDELANNDSSAPNVDESQTSSMQLLIRPRYSKNRVSASNRERYLFCRMHKKEQIMIPQGIQKGYYMNINFDELEERIFLFMDEMEDIINGKISSVFHQNVMAAYEEFGKNKARSTLKVLERFESTLPGYYGAEGSHRIMKVLSTLLIESGKLTPAKSSPQDPIEYLQQVLVPECGRRLIKQDIQSGRTRTPTGVDDDTLATATAIMHESAEFGNLIYPHADDEIEDDNRPNRKPSITEDVEESKFSHFFDEQSNSDGAESEDDDGKNAALFNDAD